MIKQFIWRDRHGSLQDITKLDTSHLYFILCMVYHNTLPEAAWVLHNPKRVSWTEYYTLEYRVQAIKWVIAELAIRTDNTPERIKIVSEINQRFKDHLYNNRPLNGDAIEYCSEFESMLEDMDAYDD